MKITIISSSGRPNSESKRVGQYMQNELAKKLTVANVGMAGDAAHIDLVDLKLPFFDDTLEDSHIQQELWNPTSKMLAESDGCVFITPEWNGMASPMLKNFLMYLDDQLAHKPVLLVGVSSGLGGGAYPIAEIRANTSKNTYICYIPNHVIVRNVNQCLVDVVVDPNNKSDNVARDRIDFSLDTLLAYTKALKDMRENETINWNRFTSGM